MTGFTHDRIPTITEDVGAPGRIGPLAARLSGAGGARTVLTRA